MDFEFRLMGRVREWGIVKVIDSDKVGGFLYWRFFCVDKEFIDFLSLLKLGVMKFKF